MKDAIKEGIVGDIDDSMETCSEKTAATMDKFLGYYRGALPASGCCAEKPVPRNCITCSSDALGRKPRLELNYTRMTERDTDGQPAALAEFRRLLEFTGASANPRRWELARALYMR